jgi:predicted dinucleotide-utilizing enzyme
MPVPNTFASATTSIPLSQLDANFATAITLGNTAIQLGNTVTTLNNMTLANVTISSGSIGANVANATADSTNVVGYMGIPQNIQNGNYNVVLADSGKHIYHPIGQAAATYTFPANSNVAFTIGSAVTIVNGSVNNITISLTSDALYLSGNGATGSRTLTQFGVATAVKVTSTSWIISGTNLT